MKTKNFPAKKLRRQLKAKGLDLEKYKEQLLEAKQRKSKKKRS